MTSALLALLACGSPAPQPAPEPAPAPAPAPVLGAIGGEPILADPVILGGISDADVEAGLAGQREAIAQCYTGAETARMGKVLVKFTIGADGTVTEADTRSSSLREPAVEACLLDQVRAATFATLSTGSKALVQYPFTFP